MSKPVLQIEKLNIRYQFDGAEVHAVRDLSLTLGAGEIVGLVGESGSGKSSLGYAILGHLGSAGSATGLLRFGDLDLLGLDKEVWQQLRGRRIGMIYQEPQTALNPSFTIGEQIAEGLRHHFGVSRSEARKTAIEWIESVHLPQPSQIYDRYPHQLSGGQLQRAVIAMAFSLQPELLILDEPTTGLDVTTQAVILDLIRDLRERTGTSMLYVSHDLGVVAELCDRVVVLYRGHMIEQDAAKTVLHTPKAPYSQRLVAAIPDLYRRHRFAKQGEGDPLTTPPLPRQYLPSAPNIAAETTNVLQVSGLNKTYSSRGQSTAACRDISFDVRQGECLAVIGESGSGKSTLAKCVMGLEQADSGSIRFDGALCSPSVHERPLLLRRRLQMVFQNPDGSLNGRRKVGATIERPLMIHGRASSKADAGIQARRLFDAVELPQSCYDRYPHELSGGQKQRVAFARALATKPDLIVCDEAVSALDVSVQGTIIDLCRKLQSEHGVAFLFITHDLGVVRQIADRTIVMLKGEVCHAGDVDSLFKEDVHPYVKGLLDAVPGKNMSESAVAS